MAGCRGIGRQESYHIYFLCQTIVYILCVLLNTLPCSLSFACLLIQALVFFNCAASVVVPSLEQPIVRVFLLLAPFSSSMDSAESRMVLSAILTHWPSSSRPDADSLSSAPPLPSLFFLQCSQPLLQCNPSLTGSGGVGWLESRTIHLQRREKDFENAEPSGTEHASQPASQPAGFLDI